MEHSRSKLGAIPPEWWDGEATPRDNPYESYSPEYIEQSRARLAKLKQMVAQIRQGQQTPAPAPSPVPQVPPKPAGT